MKILLHKSSYEKLIKQVLYIEENMDGLLDTCLRNEDFSSAEKARRFFMNYINRIESLFKELQVVDNMKTQIDSQVNLLPFIVVDSHFTLSDKENRRYFCHLSYDNIWDRKNPTVQLFFLSETGLRLLSKEGGHTVYVDIGLGASKYTISSIRII
ncbi:MAG: hypothetical protein PHO15_00280 [Eubacteriales bacterium]|nr:hypothetical protein [Eubacteriales bacterium]